VDAAYAGTTAVLPELRHHFDGLEGCDSYSTNPHKARQLLETSDSTLCKSDMTQNCDARHSISS